MAINNRDVTNLRVGLTVITVVLLFSLYPLVETFVIWNKAACGYKDIAAFLWVFDNIEYCAAQKTVVVISVTLAIFTLLATSLAVVFWFDTYELIYKLNRLLSPKGESIASIVQRYEQEILRTYPDLFVEALIRQLEIELDNESQVEFIVASEYQGIITTWGEISTDSTFGLKTRVVLVIKKFAQTADLKIEITCITQSDIKDIVVKTCHKFCTDSKLDGVNISYSQVPIRTS